MSKDKQRDPKQTKDSPKVIAPPLLFAFFLLAGFLLQTAAPVPLLPPLPSFCIGLAFAGLGAVIARAAWRAMKSQGTNIDTRKPATALVTTGIYRLSRNPLYLSLFCVQISLALFLGAFWILLMVVPFALALYHGVVKREERYLEQKFGRAYLDYKARTRRWL